MVPPSPVNDMVLGLQKTERPGMPVVFDGSDEPDAPEALGRASAGAKALKRK